MADEKDSKPVEVPNLDKVNDLAQAKLAEEGNDDDGSKDDSAEDKPKDSVDAGDDAAGGDNADESSKDDVPAPKVDKPEPAAELEHDKGTKTVEVLGIDGKRHKFASLDEIPNDFEPASYKELMVATNKLTRLEMDAEADAARAKYEKDAKETNDRVKAIQDGWDKDIDGLTKAKQLPDNAAERKTEVDAVFNYIDKQLKKGIVIDSFEEAYKAVQYDKMKAEREEAAKKQNDDKKRRGGMVQASGTPQAPKSGVREGLPRGLTLDQVHSKVLSEL